MTERTVALRENNEALIHSSLQQHELTESLRETHEQLETFVYSVAHDLRAPLRAMTGFSQLLLDDHAPGLNDTAQKLLKRIHGSSEFMDKLLLGLLAYGRAARTEVKLGPVEVRKAWEAAIFQTVHHIDESTARIDVVGPLPVARARGDTWAMPGQPVEQRHEICRARRSASHPFSCRRNPSVSDARWSRSESAPVGGR